MDNDAASRAPHAPAAAVETANDRFKKSFGNWFWGSMIAAVVVHFAVFALFPTLYAEDFSSITEELEVIDIPERIEPPPPPEEIQRPARPVISSAVLDENITIAETEFDIIPDPVLPPRPDRAVPRGSNLPVTTPFEVAPQLENREETQRTLQQEYPTVLRQAGIGGEVVLHFHISETGEVLETVLAESSGHTSMDEAAQEVAKVMRFTPAQNLDKNVAVWVRLRIEFKPGGGELVG